MNCKIVQIIIAPNSHGISNAIFEIQAYGIYPKRLMVKRNSECDPNVYFMNHDQILKLGILKPSVVDLYENKKPQELSSIHIKGFATINIFSNKLPKRFNEYLKNAVFSKKRYEILYLNGYNPENGGFAVDEKVSLYQTNF